MPLCSRCHKNVAVVFISKLEEGSASNEGYCLKCARELGLKPIDGLMRQMGITEEDLEQLTDEMTNMQALANRDMDDVDDEFYDDDSAPQDDDELGFDRTQTFPFLDKLFSRASDSSASEKESSSKESADQRKKKQEAKKRKNLKPCRGFKSFRLLVFDCIFGKNGSIHSSFLSAQ